MFTSPSLVVTLTPAGKHTRSSPAVLHSTITPSSSTPSSSNELSWPSACARMNSVRAIVSARFRLTSICFMRSRATSRGPFPCTSPSASVLPIRVTISSDIPLISSNVRDANSWTLLTVSGRPNDDRRNWSSDRW